MKGATTLQERLWELRKDKGLKMKAAVVGMEVPATAALDRHIQLFNGGSHLPQCFSFFFCCLNSSKCKFYTLSFIPTLLLESIY